MSGFDLGQACRLAKASNCAYCIGKPGGVPACPDYAAVGFLNPPAEFESDQINAALVGTTRDAVVVAFRGTLPLTDDSWDAFFASVLDWLNDTEAQLVPVTYADGRVHHGFAESLESLWSEVLSEVRNRASGKLPVLIAGHSKGGALATLAAVRLRREASIVPAGVFTYGSPRTGDQQFADDYRGHIPAHWRFENEDDIVPHLPPKGWLLKVLAFRDRRFATVRVRKYEHVGTLGFLDWEGDLVEGDSASLELTRRLHLLALLPLGEVDQLVADHSLTAQYIPRICSR